jgi:hypothetical protein
MKKHIIFLSQGIEDGEFILSRLKPKNNLTENNIVLLFTSAVLAFEYLNSCPNGYTFKFIIHFGHSKSELEKKSMHASFKFDLEDWGNDLTYYFTTRGYIEDSFEGIPVFNTDFLERKQFDLNKLKDNILEKKSTSAYCDFSILTALEKDENEVFKKNMNLLDLPIIHGIPNSKIGVFNSKPEIHEEIYKICLVHQDEMGMVDASAYTGSIISKLNPKFMIMAGVCGGLESHVNLYDIIVAEKVTNNFHGKYEKCIFR